jgi:hypothetical protein
MARVSQGENGSWPDFASAAVSRPSAIAVAAPGSREPARAESVA